MNNIIIELICAEEIIIPDKNKFNSNNHWKNDEKPTDYDTVLEKSNLKYWVDGFRDNYIVININPNELKWIKEATIIGNMTGDFPQSYNDELDSLLEKYSYLNEIFKNKKYFVRTESVSLKNGMHGIGPYDNLKKIIQSLVTSTAKHSPITEKTTNIKLYLFPWVIIDDFKEFRIFVYKNKITAISQQNCYSKNYILTKLSNEEKEKVIMKWIMLINNYFENIIKKRITHIENYTIDFTLLENNEPYFIEINSFGKEYAAGSSLFHWLLDEDKLYDTKNEGKIYFRYVC
jgi:hypothetical protein